MNQTLAIDSATRALSRAWGSNVSLQDVVALSKEERRNLILRATATVATAPARSVIIKATRADNYDGNAINAFESGLVKEWTALAFLAARAAAGAPAFLAGDAEHGVIVVEDLGADLGSLVGPLLDGPAERAERALIAYATSLGRLHAATSDCRASHAAALAASFRAARRTPPPDGDTWRRQTVDPVVARLGGVLPEGDIAEVARRVTNPGAWLGLVHRDPCPDNVMLIGDTARLIDFEYSTPGHVLLDAAYWRMGFPTCWCAGRVPDTVRARMDDAYRSALPATSDGRDFDSEMVAILFASLFGSLSWQLEPTLAEDTRWGISSRRSRILWYLDAAIAGARQADRLPDLCEVATRWRRELGARWPDSQPLALYPAFAT